MLRLHTAAGSACHCSNRPVVILGASVRALAESAVRAGWNVYAADLFGDLDLQAIATAAVPVAHGGNDPTKDYPWSLCTAAAGFPPAAVWCYTGAVENHPDLIDAIARERPLAGNPSSVVRPLRDPVHVATAATAAGISFPETRTSPEGVPLDGTFLVKPLAGAGGRGIRRWTPGLSEEYAARQAAGHALPARAPRIWQRFVAGTPLSASYCFAERSWRLLGVCRQLIGEPWCHAGLFAWCGAVTLRADGSRPDHDHLAASLTRLGDVLASRWQPVGLVGVDLVVAADGRVVVIEINPRPTASMELFERSSAGSIAASHLAACGLAHPFNDTLAAAPLPTSSRWAKAVLFAAQPTPVTQSLIDAMTRAMSPWTQADGGWPALSDIPRPGQVIAAGAPVVTIFAAGPTAEAAITTLRDRVARIDALLTGVRRHACEPATG
jgi:predicted ATP-grasp superfamily ATP-dependent carboligase